MIILLLLLICSISGLENISTHGGNSQAENCTFPFIYQGGSFSTCTTVNSTVNQPWCATTDNYDIDGKWGYCIRKVAVYEDEANDGEFCHFPFNYQGDDNYACISTPGHHSPWCYTLPNNTRRGFCMPPVMTYRGEEALQSTPNFQCKFPFDYNGQTNYKCIKHNTTRYWCATESSWGYCDNPALGKGAYQISTDATRYAYLAVDGRPAVEFSMGSCSLTDASSLDTQPWWFVNLEQIFVIDGIDILSIGGNEVYDRGSLKEFSVYISWHMAPSIVTFARSKGTLCFHSPYEIGPADAASVISNSTFPCKNGTTGQFVLLQIMHSNPTYLTMCEFGVQARYVGDVAGIYADVPQTSQYMEINGVTELEDSTFIFTNIGGFKNRCKIVGLVIYIKDLFMPVSFSVWRATSIPNKYTLVERFYENAILNHGYLYINLTNKRANMRAQKGDFFGASIAYQSTGSGVMERSCDVQNIDNNVDIYDGYHYKSGLFIDNSNSLGITYDFLQSQKCLDYFIQAVVQHDRACDSHPCLNGADCIELSESFPPNFFTCNCSAGFSGYMCEIDIDECSSSPCLNGGTCLDRIDFYLCDCGDAWNGTNCEIDFTTQVTGFKTSSLVKQTTAVAVTSGEPKATVIVSERKNKSVTYFTTNTIMSSKAGETTQTEKTRVQESTSESSHVPTFKTPSWTQNSKTPFSLPTKSKSALGNNVYWPSWLPWSSCSASCNRGVQVRFFICGYTNDTTNNNCTIRLHARQGWVLSYNMITRECQEGTCNDGIWGVWTPWSDCSSLCGRGTRTRTRTCGDRVCSGASKLNEKCNLRPCTYSRVKESIDEKIFTEADNRPSAQTVGSVYVLLLSVVLGFFILLDVIDCRRHIENARRFL